MQATAGKLRAATSGHALVIMAAGLSAELYAAYSVLGLEPSAGIADVKAAYRQIAKACHPDRNSSPESTALFQQLNQAYHMLIRPSTD